MRTRIPDEGERRQERFLAAYAEWGVVLRGLQAAGVDRATFNRWMAEDADFAALFAFAQEDYTDNLQARCHELTQTSERVAMFMLKHNRPQVYGDRIEVLRPAEKHVTSMDDAELEAIIKSARSGGKNAKKR